MIMEVPKKETVTSVYKDRIELFRKHIGIGQTAFEKKVGWPNAYIANIKEPSIGKLLNVISTYPELSRDWLFFGEGDMLRKVESEEICKASEAPMRIEMATRTVEHPSAPLNASQRMTKILEHLGMNRSVFSRKLNHKKPQWVSDIINGKTKSITDGVADQIISVFPDFRRVWLMTGEGRMTNTYEPVEETFAVSAEPTYAYGGGESGVLNGTASVRSGQDFSVRIDIKYVNGMANVCGLVEA